MFASVGFSTPRGPFAGAAPLAHRPLSAIAATIAGGVPQARIQRIIGELIPVLETLHQEGRICGDISVHSVGLDESGRAHLMTLSTDKIPADRVQALTPGYAPFELYTESANWPRGPWTDIYALSAVAYSLVAGQRPPSAPERCLADTHQPLMTLGITNYSDSFLQAIDAGLAIKPADRPQTMQAYADLLSLPAVAQEKDAMPLPPEVTDSPALADTDKPVRQRPWGAITRAVLLGIATLVLAIYWWTRLSSGPQQIITHSESVVDTGNSRVPSATAVKPSSALPPTPPHDEAPGAAETSSQPSSEMPMEAPSTAILHELTSDQGKNDTDAATSQADNSAEQAKTERKAPAAPAPVRVSINVRPWGEIVIDGVSRGVTPPLKTVMLRPGKHTVTIRNSAQPPHTMTLVVTAGKPAVITHLFR